MLPHRPVAMPSFFAIHALKLDTWDIAKKGLQPVKLVGAAIALTLAIAVMFTQSFNPFLYFRF